MKIVFTETGIDGVFYPTKSQQERLTKIAEDLNFLFGNRFDEAEVYGGDLSESITFFKSHKKIVILSASSGMDGGYLDIEWWDLKYKTEMKKSKYMGLSMKLK
jgi:hypothetical protein